MQVEAPALTNLLGMLLLAVLADRPLHGYAVVDALRLRGEGRFAVADHAVYPGLHRLEHFGFVRSTRSKVSNRTRVTYALTPEGRARLVAYRREWEDFAAVVAGLVGCPPSGDG